MRGASIVAATEVNFVACKLEAQGWRARVSLLQLRSTLLPASLLQAGSARTEGASIVAATQVNFFEVVRALTAHAQSLLVLSNECSIVIIIFTLRIPYYSKEFGLAIDYRAE